MFDELVESLIKGEYNLLTKQQDFYSQVIVASEFICRGDPTVIDIQQISKCLTKQIKKSQEIRPGRHYGNYHTFSRLNRNKHRWKRKKNKDKSTKETSGGQKSPREKTGAGREESKGGDRGESSSENDDSDSSCEENVNTEL